MMLNTGWISTVRCMLTYQGSQTEPQHRNISQQQGRLLDVTKVIEEDRGKFGPSTLEEKPGLPGLVSLPVDLSKSSSALSSKLRQRGGKGNTSVIEYRLMSLSSRSTLNQLKLLGMQLSSKPLA